MIIISQLNWRITKKNRSNSNNNSFLKKHKLACSRLKRLIENATSIAEDGKEQILRKISKEKIIAITISLSQVKLTSINSKVCREVFSYSRWTKYNHKPNTPISTNRASSQTKLLQKCLILHISAVDSNNPNLKCSLPIIFLRFFLKLLFRKHQCTWITHLCNYMIRLIINRNPSLKKGWHVIAARQNV